VRYIESRSLINRLKPFRIRLSIRRDTSKYEILQKSANLVYFLRCQGITCVADPDDLLYTRGWLPLRSNPDLDSARGPDPDIVLQ
jgi:hypothetical protein